MSERGQELSAAAEDYVKVVWNATEWSDQPVTTTQLAERLGVSKPTVSEHVRRLCDRGLFRHAPYGSIELTTAGHAAAVAMVRRHRLIETYLVTELGYTWDEVHDEAEILEHACSERMIEAISARLGHPERDPHGDPIPRADGSVPALGAVPLAQAEPGQWSVARISDADPEVLRTLAAAGIDLDVRLSVAGEAGQVPRQLSWASAEPGATLGAAEQEAVWVVPPAVVS